MKGHTDIGKLKPCAIGLLLGALYMLQRAWGGFSIGCLFHRLTGFLCPGCGVTRLLDHLIHGDVRRAFTANPAVFLLSPLILFLYFTDRINHERRSEFREKLHRILAVACLALLLLFGVLRNIPAFGFLRP